MNLFSCTLHHTCNELNDAGEPMFETIKSFLTTRTGRERKLVMNFLLSFPVMVWFWRIAPIAIGAAGGYAYYKFVGCRSGMCPITSNPWISTIYGAILGSMWVR
jgi:hypothetical protein